MRNLIIVAVVAMSFATTPAFATDHGNLGGADRSGHGEADARQIVGQMPAQRWDDALLRTYQTQFARVVVDRQLAAAPWSDDLAARYRAIFPRG
jgi:hypothetical protein